MEKHLNQVLEDARTLIECESPSNDPIAISQSADVVARVGTARLNATPELIRTDASVHVLWRFGKATRVVLLGHHDTVWPIGTLKQRPFQIRDGVLRGPGCLDMKVGIAMAFSSVAELRDRDGVAILITGDEEVGSPSSRGLIADVVRGADAALVLEAAADSGALKTARSGSARYTVEVEGRAAHAGLEPGAGVNAGIEVAHQIIRISAFDDGWAGTTVTPTVIRAGSTVNTVPANATVGVDVRARTSEELTRVDAAMQTLAPVLPGARLKVSGGPSRMPLTRAHSADLYDRARQVASRLGIEAPAEAHVGGASDGNITAELGLTTLDGLGAVGAGAHAAHEQVLVDQVMPRVRLLHGLVESVQGS